MRVWSLETEVDVDVDVEQMLDNAIIPNHHLPS